MHAFVYLSLKSVVSLTQSTKEMCGVQIYFELLVVIFSSSHNITSWWEKAWTHYKNQLMTLQPKITKC